MLDGRRHQRSEHPLEFPALRKNASSIGWVVRLYPEICSCLVPWTIRLFISRGLCLFKLQRSTCDHPSPHLASISVPIRITGCSQIYQYKGRFIRLSTAMSYLFQLHLSCREINGLFSSSCSSSQLLNESQYVLSGKVKSLLSTYQWFMYMPYCQWAITRISSWGKQCRHALVIHGCLFSPSASMEMWLHMHMHSCTCRTILVALFGSVPFSKFVQGWMRLYYRYRRCSLLTISTVRCIFTISAEPRCLQTLKVGVTFPVSAVSSNPFSFYSSNCVNRLRFMPTFLGRRGSILTRCN